MKSKVKYAALVLVIGLLSLVILPTPVFGGGPKPSVKYNIKIVDTDSQTVVAEFEAASNKDGTRIVGDEKYQQGMPTVEMNFPDSLIPSDNAFRTSTIPAVSDVLQDLDSLNWKYHSGSLDYRKNTLSFRFDLFYIYIDTEGRGAHDHYILGIGMEFWENGESGDATLNWTHYTEPIKPRGKNLQVEFQQLKRTIDGELTITITRL